jgi:membrane protease YdiL (CAAX protease family)
LNARALFVAPSGAIRAPWRIAIFFALVAASYIASDALAGPAISMLLRSIGVTGVANESWVTAIALLVATAICIRLVDRRRWSDVWLDAAAARPKYVAGGFAIGALTIAVPIVALIGTGWLHAAASASGSWMGACLRVSAMLVPAALAEELLMRGYLLSVLRESWGWVSAVAATSVAFGLLHLKNPGATAGFIAMVTLAGFFLAAVLYRTRSLYAAWAAHFAWNWTMAVLFHASVSGLPLESPGYRYVDAGPDWATGGAWGPEGGVPAAIGMAGGIALLFAGRRRRSRGGADSSDQSLTMTRPQENS